MKLIDSDIFRYEGNCKLKTKLRYFIFTPGFRYSYLMRRTASSSNLISRMFWKFLMRQCMLRTGIQIPEQTKIGPGLRIVHFGAIVVNPGVIIGKNFSIAQNCLIGNASGKRAGVPVIGDNVCMNANSVIIGGVKIGNNVLIAPGAFVNFDVPDNSVVIGNPGKIIAKVSSPTAKYIVYPYKD